MIKKEFTEVGKTQLATVHLYKITSMKTGSTINYVRLAIHYQAY